MSNEKQKFNKTIIFTKQFIKCFFITIFHHPFISRKCRIQASDLPFYEERTIPRHKPKSVGAAAQRRVPVKIPQKGCLKTENVFSGSLNV